MNLSLEDPRLKVKLDQIRGDTIRLVIEYPAEDRYRDRILGALADIIRPPKQVRKELPELRRTEGEQSCGPFDGMQIAELDLGLRTYNKLREWNVNTVGELARLSSATLMTIPGFGPKLLSDVERCLSIHGLRLRTE